MNTKWEETFDERYLTATFLMPEMQNAWIDLINDQKAFIKDQITKAQQEIAEQIIDDIPDEFEGKIYALPKRLKNFWDLKPIKDQLRKKYLIKRL